MGNSSVLGVQQAPVRPSGVDADALGPSDNSDSASDRIGAEVAEGTDPLGVAGEPDDEASDISVDRVIEADGAGLSMPLSGDESGVDEDEDPDLAFIDEAEAGDPLEDEQQARDGDDPTDDAMARPRP
jgi:hypothetical protein